MTFKIEPLKITIDPPPLWIRDLSFGYLSKFIEDYKYEALDTLEINGTNYTVFNLKGYLSYVVGTDVETNEGVKLALIARIELERVPDILHYTNLYNVEHVRVKDNLQGSGIARTLYTYLVKKLGYTLLGNEIQYFGARRLWARLSHLEGVAVDVIDISEPKLLYTDTGIYHGTEDADFDLRIWRYEEDKKDIRLILRDVSN